MGGSLNRGDQLYNRSLKHIKQAITLAASNVYRAGPNDQEGVAWRSGALWPTGHMSRAWVTS